MQLKEQQKEEVVLEEKGRKRERESRSRWKGTSESKLSLDSRELSKLLRCTVVKMEGKKITIKRRRRRRRRRRRLKIKLFFRSGPSHLFRELVSFN